MTIETVMEAPGKYEAAHTLSWRQGDPYVRIFCTLKNTGKEQLAMEMFESFSLDLFTERLTRAALEGFERAPESEKELPVLFNEYCTTWGNPSHENMQASMDFIEKVKREIPIIAANLHRLIHPAQSQIWAVIRQEDSVRRIVYSVANTFLGRMCISGDVTELSEEQWAAIDEGIAFYHKIAPVIKEGLSLRFGPKIKSARHPKGWQGMVWFRKGVDGYVVLHTFGGELPEVIEIPLPDGCPEHVAEIYAAGEKNLRVENRVLRYRQKENWEAVAVRLG